MTKPWNRCAHCGRFISFADFESGRATRVLTSPDAEGSTETYLNTCAACRKEMRGEDEA